MDEQQEQPQKETESKIVKPRKDHLFKPGNKLGAPYAKKASLISSLRSSFVTCFTSERMTALAEELYRLAHHSKSEKVRLQAAELILDRLLGKPKESLAIEIDAAQGTRLDRSTYSDEQINAALAALAPPAPIIDATYVKCEPSPETLPETPPGLELS